MAQQPLLITDRPHQHAAPQPSPTPWFEEPDTKAALASIVDPEILRHLDVLKHVKSKAFVFDVLVPRLDVKDAELILLKTDERGPGGLRNSRQELILKFFERLEKQDDIMVLERNSQTKVYLMNLLVENCKVPGSQRIIQSLDPTRLVFRTLGSQDAKTITVLVNNYNATPAKDLTAQTCYVVEQV